MDRQKLKNKYNDYYKEYKKKEFYQLSQFDKLFILLLDIASDTNTIINNNTTNVTNNVLVNKTLEIKFVDSLISNLFTLPSTNCLLITPRSDKHLTINLEIAYYDKWVPTNLFIDTPTNTNLVVTNFTELSGIVNRKDSCRLVSNETITATYLMYYV